MRKIPKDTRDRPHADGLEPVVGDRDSLTVVSSFGILLLPIFLLEDHFSWFEENAEVQASRNGNLAGMLKELCYSKTEILGDAEKCREMRRDGGGIMCYDKEIVEVSRRRMMWHGCTDRELC